MDATATRRRNVVALVHQFGGPTEFGRLIERDQAQVSQWTSDKKPKPIGGRLARYIEGRLGHERGWLDTPQWEGEPLQDSHSLRLDPDMLAETHKALRELDHDNGRVFSIEREPARFVQAYQMRAGMPEEPSKDEWIKFGQKLVVLSGAGTDERSDGVPIKGTVTSKQPKGVRR